METKYQYLQFIPYATIRNWSVQYMKGEGMFSSIYPIKQLGDYIKEESERYSISDPSCEYGILGVNNQNGIFDAYTENGAKIKQRYKKMEVGWIAYNPYRINVGSVGVKRDYHNNDYISPAYVVFSCKEELLPDFLYLIMRTPIFNQIIRNNTTGSVRQSLSFKALSALKIPLPSLEEQRYLLSAYLSIVNKSVSNIQAIEQEEQKTKSHILSSLGIIKNDGNRDTSLLRFIHFKDTLKRWDVYAVKEHYLSNWPIIELGNLIASISTGTTPPTSHKEYFDGNICFYTPADISDEIYLQESERHISQKALDDGKARAFEKGTILFVGIGSTVGKVGIVEKEKVTSNQQITGFKVDEQQILPEYVFCFLHYNKDISTAEQAKTTLPIVNQSKIAKIPIPLPPKEIQEDIVSYVKAAKVRIKALRSEAESLKAQALHDFEKALFK